MSPPAPTTHPHESDLPQAGFGIPGDILGLVAEAAVALRSAAGWAPPGRRWTERHLQCIWYDERLRPSPLLSAEGEIIEVLQPGRWNLEAGPDFLDAEIRVGRTCRILRGDVEVHARAADWSRHHHAGDPRYAGVVLHLTYAEDADPGLPSHVQRVALQRALMLRRDFSFDDIDLRAYPHALIPATARPCQLRLEPLAPAEQDGLLEAAGRRRLVHKAHRVADRLWNASDRAQVFYEELMAILGAKQNTAAFRKLAEALPLHAWPAKQTVEDAYARLLGTAGLLPDPRQLQHPEAGAFARDLWDRWFRAGGGIGASEPSPRWTLHGLRPLNHPLRRLAAAARMLHRPTALLERLDALPVEEPRTWVRTAMAVLQDCGEWPFWDVRAALDAAPATRRIALLGRARAAAVLSNAVLPLLIAKDPRRLHLADALPAEDLSAPMRETAFRLFGRDHNPARYASHGLRQQGLLGIEREFCLTTREACDDCILAQRLGAMDRPHA